MLLFLALHLGAACQVDGDVEGVDTMQGEEVIDLRVDYPDPPENGLQILTPDLEIAPYDEKLFCYFAILGPGMGQMSASPSTSPCIRTSFITTASCKT